ncbi:MAG TPA: SMC-Scp complex subunit ScpB [Gemmataceae bacterium]|jgi:segregation and condensation protein B
MSRTKLYGPLARRRSDCLPADHRPPRWPRRPAAAEPAVAGPDVRDARLARLEAVLFAAEEPLAARRLAALAELADAADARRLVERLRDLLAAEGSAFRVEELAGGYQLLTRPEFHPWLVRLRQTAGEPKLTGALLETLAIVAYRQPIMRADLEAVRGVHCGEALRQLMERGLVRIAGRDDSLGRPVLYGTTKKFLQTFGLRDLRDLPPVGG